jgi:hypothetical protein
MMMLDWNPYQQQRDRAGVKSCTQYNHWACRSQMRRDWMDENNGLALARIIESKANAIPLDNFHFIAEEVD